MVQHRDSVDLVVVTYNNPRDDVIRLVDVYFDALARLGVTGTVHLVANDGTVQIASSERVRTHVGHGNVGFARGVAIGVESSKAQFCVISNPDCTPAVEDVAAFIERLEPGCGVLVPRILDGNGRLDYLAYEDWTFTPGRKYAEWRCRRDLHRLSEGPLPQYAKAPGTFIGVETEVALSLGPFDDRFLLYAEDRDLKDRCRVLGIPVRYLPSINVPHASGVSAESVPPLVAEAKTDGYLRVARRRFGRVGAVLAVADLWLLRKAGKSVCFGPGVLHTLRRWLRSTEPARLKTSLTDGLDSERPLRVLILWADNSAANFGVRVLAEGNAALIRRAAGSRAVHVDWQDFGPGDSTVSFGTRSILRDLFRSRGPIKTKLAGYDLIVNSGAGDSFADIYGFKRLSFMAYAHFQAARLHKPIIFGPQTIGPFATWWGRLIGRQMLGRARFVAARDAISADFSESLGRPVDIVTTDLVFGLESNRPAAVNDVVLNVSGLLWFGSEHVDAGMYRAETAALVERLVSAGRTVTLLPHVVRSRNGHDDIDASRDLIEMVAVDLRPVLHVPADLQEARETIRGAQLVIGARMHACLNALSQGVPSIAWAYSRKFEPLMASIDWPYVIDLRKTTSPAAKTMQIITEESKGMSRRARAVPERTAATLEALVDTVSPHLPFDNRAGDRVR